THCCGAKKRLEQSAPDSPQVPAADAGELHGIKPDAGQSRIGNDGPDRGSVPLADGTGETRDSGAAAANRLRGWPPAASGRDSFRSITGKPSLGEKVLAAAISALPLLAQAPAATDEALPPAPAPAAHQPDSARP